MKPGSGQVIFAADLSGTQNAAEEEVADERLIGCCMG
jgi:hypothetical protein